NLLHTNAKLPMNHEFPDEIISSGLSLERQWYLYEEVRQHIQNQSKCDAYCPKPQQPKPKKQHKK
ncbi:13902_t:CDS:1, partial [Dentiscutata heterogama]